MMQTARNSRIGAFAVITLAACLLSAPVTAQVQGRSTSGRCRVEGTITDPDGNPVAGVLVNLINQETKAKNTKVKSNKKGKFSHPLVVHGPYKLEFIKDDMKVYFLSMENHASDGTNMGSFEAAHFGMAAARLDNTQNFAASGQALFKVMMATPDAYDELAMKAAQGSMPDADISEKVISRRHPAEEARELFELKNYKGALVKFEEAEAMEGGNQDADVAFAMAQTYFYLGEHQDEAAAKFRQVVELDRGETRTGVNYFLALIADQQGRKSEAVAFMEEEVAGLDDPPSSMLTTMGSLYRDQGEDGKAIASLERAIEKDPANLAALVNLGSLYNAVGDKAKAEQYFQAAATAGASQGKKGAAIFFNIGALAVNEGKMQAAADAFERALDLNPNYSAAHLELGYTYKDLGQDDKAIEHFGTYLKLNPKASEKDELELWMKHAG
jgi:tetratricopeptide (TPR) repeat protein